MNAKNEHTPVTPPAEDTGDPSDSADTALKSTEQAPLDPKEIARQRSKADLQRKRHNQRSSHGKF